MTRCRFLTALALVLLSLTAPAQTPTVRGVVVGVDTVPDNNDRFPLPGVAVNNLKSGIGTYTDIDGNFEIPAQVGDSLVFYYVNYEEQSLAVADPEEFLRIPLKFADLYWEILPFRKPEQDKEPYVEFFFVDQSGQQIKNSCPYTYRVYEHRPPIFLTNPKGTLRYSSQRFYWPDLQNLNENPQNPDEEIILIFYSPGFRPVRITLTPQSTNHTQTITLSPRQQQ